MPPAPGISGYQDRVLPGEIIPGERACEERWQFIAPLLPTKGMILDVGSNLGYYVIRAVRERDHVAVVSMESDEESARQQARLLEANGVDRACLVQGRMGADVAADWAETCDWFDLTLLLAVLHWTDDPAGVLRHLASMSGTVVVELPDAADEGACGRDLRKLWPVPLEWVAKVTGRKARLLGRCQRHTSAVPSHLIAIEGPVHRRPTVPYWKSRFTHPGGQDYSIGYDGVRMQLSIRGRAVEYVPGVNLVNLTSLGRLLWPHPGLLEREASIAAQAVPGHLDPLPHNFVWTPLGLTLIDADDQRGVGDSIEGARATARLIRLWAMNRSTDPKAYVPHIPWFLRRLRNWPRYLAGKYLPPAVQRTVKRWLREE